MSLTTGFGNFYCQKLIEKLLGGTNFSAPATWYGAMLTNDATDDDGTTLVEVTSVQYTGYARVPKTNDTTGFPPSTVISHVCTLSLGTVFDWGTSSGGTGCTVVGVALYDALTSGNLGPWGPLVSGKVLAGGDGFKINAGNLTFTMS